MIVAQVEKVRKQLINLAQLEDDSKSRQDIKDTTQELGQVETKIRQFAALYELIRDRLETQQNLPITNKISFISNNLKNSHQDFASQRRQVKPLQNIKNDIDLLKQQAETEWKIYTENQLKPQFELLKLVRQLPEVKPQITELDNLKQSLEKFMYRSPIQKAELLEFDKKLQLLSQRLANLRLDPVIKDFLDKVLKGEATLADLSDEILAWCQQGGRARTFRIIFK